MPAHNLEAEIDRLYRLTPEEFTPARNALAKQLQAEEARKVKALRKPNLPAWAVNQLYWTSPDLFKELQKTVERLRAAHKLAIAGRPADLQAAGSAHREALKKALSRVQEILRESGRPINADTTRAVTQTLEALREEDTPGRLDRPLEPQGFDALKDVAPPRHGSSVTSGRTAGSRAMTPVSRFPVSRGAQLRAPENRSKVKDLRLAEKEAARERARALAGSRQDLKEAERALSASRNEERARRREADRLSRDLETARKKEAAARQGLERAQGTRAALEERKAFAMKAADQAAAASAAFVRAVREARDTLKSIR